MRLSDMYGVWFLFVFNVVWKRNIKCCLRFKNKDKFVCKGGGVLKKIIVGIRKCL